LSGNTKSLLEMKKEAHQILNAISKDHSIVSKMRKEDLRKLIHLGFIKSVKASDGLAYVITEAGLRLLEEYHAMPA